mgnify:CR=1 FL=1
MKNAEAKVCLAAGPRWEARSGAGGQEVGEECVQKGFCLKTRVDL